MSKVRVRKLDNSSSCKILSEGTYMYDPSLYFKDIKYNKYNGEDVKVCVIGTGVPFHKDFGNIEEYVNFSQEATTEDKHGLSVQIGGIIGANNPEDGVIGMAFSSSLYFAKALDDNGSGDINSLNASLLWSIVKNVDLVVIPFEFPEANSALVATMKKIKEQNICVLNYGQKAGKMFKGVCSIQKRKKYNVWTTSSGVGDYIKPSTKVANLGISAAIMTIIIGKLKKSKKGVALEKVYSEFERIL